MPPSWSKRSLAVQAMGAIEPVTQGGRAADPSRHHLHPRRGQRLFVGLRLRPARQRHGARRPRAVLAMLEDAARGAALRLRHGGRDRGVPGARARRPRRRAAGDVLGAAQLARHRGDALGLARRLRRDRRSRCARSGGAAGRDQARLDRDAREPALDHHRHRRRGRDRASRRAPGSPSIRPRPRRCIRARWRSAPTSSCMPRPRS